MAFDRNFPSKAMSEHEKFVVPHEIDEILDRLPPQVTLHVPDNILSRWFTGAVERRHARTRAQLRQKLRLQLRVSWRRR
jgi:hypothetical protein